MHKKNSFTFSACFLAVSTALALSACGGGGGADTPAPVPTSTPTPAASAISGTVAGGAAIIGASVIIKDAKGTITNAVITSSNGSYTVPASSLSKLTPPLLIKVSGGTLNGQANTQDLYSVSINGGTAHVSPLTTMLVASLTGQDPATLFNELGIRVTSLNSIISTSSINNATQNVTAELRARGLDTSKLDSLLSGDLRAGDPSNAYDQLLDQLLTSTSSLSELVNKVASDSAKFNGDKPLTGGTPLKTSFTDATFGECMLGASLPTNLASVTVAAPLPTTQARWVFNQYTLKSYASNGSLTFGQERTAKLDILAEQVYKWRGETGEESAAMQPSILRVQNTTNLINQSVNNDSWNLVLVDAFSLVGRQYLGYLEKGVDTNPAGLNLSSTHEWGFFHGRDLKPTPVLDTLKKGQVVAGASGSRFFTDAMNSAVPFSSTVIFEGSANITTALGAMKTCKVRTLSTFTRSGAVSSMVDERWYAPKLGLVRRDYHETRMHADNYKDWELTQSRELVGKLLGNINYGQSLSVN